MDLSLRSAFPVPVFGDLDALVRDLEVGGEVLTLHSHVPRLELFADGFLLVALTAAVGPVVRDAERSLASDCPADVGRLGAQVGARTLDVGHAAGRSRCAGLRELVGSGGDALASEGAAADGGRQSTVIALTP
eukprot:SAG31_NODE_1071_length_10069_cov_3.085356_6_plen_133_part_00